MNIFHPMRGVEGFNAKEEVGNGWGSAHAGIGRTGQFFFFFFILLFVFIFIFFIKSPRRMLRIAGCCNFRAKQLTRSM